MPLIKDQIVVEGLSYQNTLAYSLTSTPTSTGGNLTLTITSAFLHMITGTATGFSVVFPDATTLVNGWRYEIQNMSSQAISIKDNTGAVLINLLSEEIGFATLQSNSTAAGVWSVWSIFSNTANGILNYKLTSATPFACTSTTDVVITDFTLTPQSGTYAVWYNADCFYTTTPRYHWWSIYKGGTQITDSQRSQITSRSNQSMFQSTITTSQFNGTQACDIRVRRDSSGGTLTVNSRTLIMIRLGE